VRAVEDADLAGAGHLLVDTPQEVVGQLLGRRLLEAGDRRALWVESGHHAPDRAVLARRVDALQDDQHLVLVLGPQPVLQVGQPLEVPGGGGLSVLLAPAVAVARVNVGQAHLLVADTQLGAQVRAVTHLRRLAEPGGP
jgi:hypothetical protein